MTENDEITAGSSNVYPILWEFNADWAGLTKEILFTVDADLSTTPLPLMRLYLDDNGMCQIPFEVLQKVMSRIINEVKGVNRVFYDLTSKPPGTIEFE